MSAETTKEFCRVSNETGISGVRVFLKCHVGSRCDTVSNTLLSDEGEFSDVELPRLVRRSTMAVESWTLGLDRPGLVASGYHSSCHPGESYVIECDPVDPALTEEQKRAIDEALFEAVEGGVQSEEKRMELASQRVFGGGRREKVLNRYLCDDPPPALQWRDYYRPPVVAGDVSCDEVARVLKSGGPCRIEAYWRSLDRFPRDNPHMDTVRFRFDVGVADASVVCHAFDNWSSDLKLTSCDLASAFDAGGIEQVVASVLGVHEDEHGGGQNVEWNIVDAKATSDTSEDTEWSSVEVLVYLPVPWSPLNHAKLPRDTRGALRAFDMANARPDASRPRLGQDLVHRVFELLLPEAEWKLVFRLHQSAVLGPQFRRRPG